MGNKTGNNWGCRVARTRYLVRKAIGQDADELSRLRWDFRPDDQPKQEWESFRRAFGNWLEETLASDRWVTAVAESEEGSLIGCMSLESVEKVPNPGGIRRESGYVANAYVSPERRGMGIGASLLDILISGARGPCARILDRLAERGSCLALHTRSFPRGLLGARGTR